MLKVMIAAAVTAAALGAAGCQSVLTNLQACERHYNGVSSASLTGAQFSGTVKIDCYRPGEATAPATGTPAAQSATPPPAS